MRRARHRRRRLPARTPGALVPAAAAAAAALALALAGCSSAVPATPGPQAADPVCSRVLTALPDRLVGLSQRSTTAQATTAWGDPPVVLRCGVTQPGPSPQCQHVTSGGRSVDWVVGRSRGGRATWTTFGRTPAVQLLVPRASASPGDVAVAVAGAVALTTAHARCTPGAAG